ncbi:hypothetical protein PYW07_000774 [Mythimna separata]|uniref:Adenylate kinase n=1 Tax=Mythimna separata TaxID=271217 RepID=A0AAD7YS64_MYTSE|nr:hypothetical protein PYW07_000774 [Mythimna separata]
MATNEPATNVNTTCPCPKFCPLPTCPYHEDLSKLNTIEVTVSSTAPIDTNTTPILWVLGGPGSGKETQCDKIAAKYGYTHLSTGALLRAEIAKSTGTDRAKTLVAIIEKGGLAPTEYVLALVKDEIRARAATTKGFLVDGFPRETSQGLEFEMGVAPPTAILYFEVSEKTLTDRLLARAKDSGRLDDNENTIKQRLKTFQENNQLILDQYSDKVVKINGEGSEDETFAEVEKVMEPIVATAVAR